MYFSAFQIEDPYRSPKKLWQFCHFLADDLSHNQNDASDNGKLKNDDENYVMLQVRFFSRNEQN